MKKSYKHLLCFALSGLMCSFIAFTANAQRGGRGGGGVSRGGSVGMSRPSFGGGGISRGSSRPSISNSRPNYSSRGPSVSQSRPSGPSSIARSNTYMRNNSGRANIVAPGSRYNTGITRNQGYYRPGYNRYYGNRYYGNRYYYNGRYYYGNRYGYNRFYYPYSGFYASMYLPHIGFSIGVLPYGYYPFYWNNMQYYYSGGLYYQQQDDQYTVVEPPVGAEIKQLPSDAKPIKINGVQYYELNGVYYEAVTKDDGTATYMIAGKDGELNTDSGYAQMPLVGDIAVDLPADSRAIVINGDKLYVSPDGIYYKEDRDANNDKVYKVVGVPGDDNQPAGNDDSDDE